MKRKKTLLLGTLSGLLCACAVFLFMQGVQGEANAVRAEALSRYGGEQIEVCVASRDIAAGEKIDASKVITKLWIADLLPQDAVRSLADIAGKQASSSILAGEVISKVRFEGGEYSFEVPADLSAISVPAKEVQTIGGLLKAGMRVDVYATGVDTSLLARDVLVVAASNEGSSKSAVSWVTLALKPELVQEVIAVSQKMELYFVLPGADKGRS